MEGGRSPVIHALSDCGLPAPEIPKQLAIGAADLALCAGIYQIYYDKPIDTASATALFTELGLVTAAGVGACYVASS